jgi:large subunit ribosomal protein L40e
MHIFLKTEATTLALEVEKDACVGELMGLLTAEGLMAENQYLVIGGSKVRCDYTLESLGVSDNAVIDLAASVQGGAKDKGLLEPIVADLAFERFVRKKICRSCYATNSMKANKCRKRRCGHWPDLRLKKERKEKSGK